MRIRIVKRVQAKSVESRQDYSCSERQGLPRAVMMFPKIVEPATEQGTTNGEKLARSLATPQHAGLFEPLADDGFAAGLHHARTNEIAGLAECLVHHFWTGCAQSKRFAFWPVGGVGVGRADPLWPGP